MRFVREYAVLFGGSFSTVNARTHRASQYLPDTGIYGKHPLHMRTVMAGNRPVQRDLLAACNLMSTDEQGLKEINAALAAEGFPRFLQLHDAEIRRLMQLPRNVLGRHLRWYIRGFVTTPEYRCCGTAPSTAVSSSGSRWQDLSESAGGCGTRPSGPLRKQA